MVGTHSRAIDGLIINTLTAAGDWALEIERPCYYDNRGGTLTPVVDGVQGWKNKRLSRDARPITAVP